MPDIIKSFKNCMHLVTGRKKRKTKTKQNWEAFFPSSSTPINIWEVFE